MVVLFLIWSINDLANFFSVRFIWAPDYFFKFIYFKKGLYSTIEILGSSQYKYSIEEKQETPNCFLLDCTPNPRPFANKLADRTIVHAPNPAPGNKPICVGHQYSVLALLGQDERLVKSIGWFRWTLKGFKAMKKAMRWECSNWLIVSTN